MAWSQERYTSAGDGKRGAIDGGYGSGDYGEIGEFVRGSLPINSRVPDIVIVLKFPNGHEAHFGIDAIEGIDTPKEVLAVGDKVKVKLRSAFPDAPPDLAAGEYEVTVVEHHATNPMFLADFGRGVGGFGKNSTQWWVMNKDIVGPSIVPVGSQSTPVATPAKWKIRNFGSMATSLPSDQGWSITYPNRYDTKEEAESMLLRLNPLNSRMRDMIKEHCAGCHYKVLREALWEAL